MDRKDPRVSPLYADLKGFPPTLIQVGSAETLLDDATRFAAIAGAADVRVTLEIWPHMIHAWPLWNAHLEAGRRALADCRRIYQGESVRRQRRSDRTQLQQAALAKIAEITARRTFDQIDRELEQAHFPGVIHALNDRAERFVCALDAAPGAIDHCVD